MGVGRWEGVRWEWMVGGVSWWGGGGGRGGSR